MRQLTGRAHAYSSPVINMASITVTVTPRTHFLTLTNTSQATEVAQCTKNTTQPVQIDILAQGETLMNKITNLTLSTSLISMLAMGTAHASDVYADFPITLKGYSGDAKTSESYGGQMARHMLHNGLKKAASSGDMSKMETYFNGAKSVAILDPKSSSKFPIKQKLVEELSGGKTLIKKTYKGNVIGWPGNMTGAEVIQFMMEKAASSPKGFDPNTGYNYPQLISKFAMGAVFYNQACTNYLGDKKLSAKSKPNNAPYKDGARYTGKEHVWDEAFGYWGAAAHTLTLSAKESYEVAKKKNLSAADYNKDGVVDAGTEMTYAHAYYASGFDKGGKTNYLETVTRAFLDGRKAITAAKGEALGWNGRTKMKKAASTICANWEKVIAEAVFKYAGSVYKDLDKLNTIMEAKGDPKKAFATYAKHWGEAKGFAMALEAGKEDRSAVSTKLTSLLGYGPWLPNLSQVTDIAKDGSYVKDEASTLAVYQLHMLKIQKLMVDEFGIAARNNDMLGSMDDLAAKLGGSGYAEND